MKITSGNVRWMIMGFIWSIFMGVTAVSIGLGSLFPDMNLVAAPFVCPNGQMKLEENVSNPLPGTTYTLITWYCVDNQTGAKTELGIFPMSLYSGAFYGLLIFVAVLIIWYFVSRRKVSSTLTGDEAALKQGAQYGNQAHQFFSSESNFDQGEAQAVNEGNAPEDAFSRMKELKKLRAANMISETEYEQKRSEILKDV